MINIIYSYFYKKNPFLFSICDVGPALYLIFLQGHLLVLENFNSLKLNHASMEAGYVGHHDLTLHPGQVDHGQILSISMTATTDVIGNLVLGRILRFSLQFSRTTVLIFFNVMLKD